MRPCVKLATCWGWRANIWKKAGEMERRKRRWSRWFALATDKWSRWRSVVELDQMIRCASKRPIPSIPFLSASYRALRVPGALDANPGSLVNLGSNLNESRVGHHTVTNKNFTSAGRRNRRDYRRKQMTYGTCTVLRSAKSLTCVNTHRTSLMLFFLNHRWIWGWRIDLESWKLL